MNKGLVWLLKSEKCYNSKPLLLKNFYFIKDFPRSESHITTIYKVRVKYGIINLQACLKWCVMSKFW